MSEDIKEKVKEFILTELRARAGDVEEKDMQENLIESGVIDSFGFLELLVSIEQQFHVQINFAELDPVEFTTLEGLVFHCVKAIAESK